MRSTRRAFVLLMLMLASCALIMPAATAAVVQDKSVVYDHASTYPRMVRLEHSGLANGRILVSIGGWSGNNGMGIINESDDDGKTFHQLATIPDPDAANGHGICCSTLYELPRSVGSMPAGTLLFADTVGFLPPGGKTQTKQKLWTSVDNGYHWSFRSNIVASTDPHNTWEPEFSVAKDGSLVAFISDERDKAKHDQKLDQLRSTDGRTWTDQKDTVVSDDQQVRPGMAMVRQLPDGTYFMAYEVCNNDLKHLCALYHRSSKDGWDYGDPHNLGTVVRTPDGKYLRHTPGLAWSPKGPGKNGSLLLTSEILVNADGSYAPGNGGTIVGNDNKGDGPWYEMPAPIKIANVVNNGCRNFSPSILPSWDGKSVIEVTTDMDGTVCKTYSGTGPLTHP